MNTSTSKKRRDHDTEDSTTEQGSPTATKAADGSTTNFRNVSACNRCRTRKNRCDQKLPRCSGCEKANVKCVGFDPVSKRAIPRSYVYYLETRVRNLESLLGAHSIPFPPPKDDFSISEDIKPGENVPFPVLDADPHLMGGTSLSQLPEGRSILDPVLRERHDHGKLNKFENDDGMASAQIKPESKYLDSSAGIPFARVVFAAVKSAVSHTPSERGSTKGSRLLPSEGTSGGGTNTRDSFFGLHTKPAIKPASFPDKVTAQRLVELYFEHANPQIPILHRVEFMALFDRVYAAESKKRTARELYLLNIVFAIGSGIIMDSSNVEQSVAATESAVDATHSSKRQRIASQNQHPEEYHSSAVVHLEHFLNSPTATEDGGGGLEELQAVLLLAGLALLRPVAPGLWYIIGVAVRLAVDLGLHSEDVHPERNSAAEGEHEDGEALGRKFHSRDLRRRLWWCVYSFDRLVSTCVGRPFGITDHVITTEFPSLLDDKYITTDGLVKPPAGAELPSYKLVAHHYFRLRLLQSEILQVLQQGQADKARAMGANRSNLYIHKNLASPFLSTFDSYRDWRFDVDRRLWEWRESAPQQWQTGVAFTPLFLELNYWQAIIMLYRQSLAVPEPLAAEISRSGPSDVQSPSVNIETKEDEEMVFMKVAQAGQMVLKLYRQLHRLKLVNYTFLATHHLFMSGISFLYAIWHSTLVRSQLTLDDVDFTVLIATSVLTDLIEKCPPAEACRDAFVRMSKATISMCEKTTGFGNASTLGLQQLHSPTDSPFSSRRSTQQAAGGAPPVRLPKRKMTMPKFDMNLKDLFSDEEIASRPLTHQYKPQGFAQSNEIDRPSFNNFSLPPSQQQTSDDSFDNLNTLPDFSSVTQSSPDLSFDLSNQQPYQPFAETISQAQSDFTFDDMSFLDTFPVADPNPGAWGSWNNSGNELDLGFGTGGTGYDGGENWDASGIDLLGGLFFFNDNGGNGI